MGIEIRSRLGIDALSEFSGTGYACSGRLSWQCARGPRRAETDGITVCRLTALRRSALGPKIRRFVVPANSTERGSFVTQAFRLRFEVAPPACSAPRGGRYCPAPPSDGSPCRSQPSRLRSGNLPPFRGPDGFPVPQSATVVCRKGYARPRTSRSSAQNAGRRNRLGLHLSTVEHRRYGCRGRRSHE